jgi:hypothetical protein
MGGKKTRRISFSKGIFGNSGELSNNSEAYAEYCAYTVLDKDYAREDVYLNKVCKLIKKDFENIKRTNKK